LNLLGNGFLDLGRADFLARRVIFTL